MSILFLLAIQAAGQEVTTFYPLPPKQQEQKELRQAQGLPAGTPVAAAAPPVGAPQPKPAEAVKIEVMSVKAVPADANAVFVPETQKPK